MRFLITPDSYKESLSALDAAKIMKQAILKVIPDAECILAPMADGGEGTLECLYLAGKGKRVNCKVTGPLGDRIDADFLWFEDQKKAIIEVAKACGMMLVDLQERNPLNTSTYGVGEMILEALRLGCKELVLTLGGSVTNDGGIGMLVALGAKILDRNRKPVEMGGKGLEQVAEIDLQEPKKLLANIHVKVLCDVKIPLLGERGATCIFGKQKGADEIVLKRLEKGMENYARVLNKNAGREITELEGAGAAGGLGSALFAICDAEYVSGAAYCMKIMHLEEKIRQCDYVLTGEGSMDIQSLEGKAPLGIAQIAGKYHKPVVAFVGMCKDSNEAFYEKGITAIFCMLRKIEPLDKILNMAEQNLFDAVENFVRIIAIGK